MNEIQLSKKIIIEELEKEGYKVEKIFLFGSRVKENFRKDSDWDFYVMADKDLDFQKKRTIAANIRIRLAKLKIPNDIIIQSKSVVNKRKDDVGYLTYYVLKEGIEI